MCCVFSFFFQAEDGIRDTSVTGVQTCALPIYSRASAPPAKKGRAKPAAHRVAPRPSRFPATPSAVAESCAYAQRRQPREIGRASCRERGEMAEVRIGRKTEEVDTTQQQRHNRR